MDYSVDLEWISGGFYFIEPLDKKKYRIFKAFVETTKHGKGLSSDRSAEKLGVTRGTMVGHFSKMTKRGLVTYREGQYKLRGRILKTYD